MANRAKNLAERKSVSPGPAVFPWEGHTPSLVLSPYLRPEGSDKLLSNLHTAVLLKEEGVPGGCSQTPSSCLSRIGETAFRVGAEASLRDDGLTEAGLRCLLPPDDPDATVGRSQLDGPGEQHRVGGADEGL